MHEEEQNGEFSNHAEGAPDSTNTNASEDTGSEPFEQAPGDAADDLGLKNDAEIVKTALSLREELALACRAFCRALAKFAWMIWNAVVSLFKKLRQLCKFLLSILRKLGWVWDVVEWLGKSIWKVIRFVANLLWWLWIALLKLEVLILSFGTHKVVKRNCKATEVIVPETPKALTLSDEDNSAPVDVPSDVSVDQTNEQKEK